MARALYSEELGYSGEEQTIRDIQIAFSYDEDYIRNNLLGKHLKVTGEVMYGHTAHHLTTVLLTNAYADFKP